jgi:hypothetical protein
MASLSDLQGKATELRRKLDETEKLKSELTSKLAKVEAEIRAWERTDSSGNKLADDEIPRSEEIDPEQQKVKRLKALNKKLQQIDKLKQKDDLSPEEQRKILSEDKIKRNIEAVKGGREEEDSDDDQTTPQKEFLPQDPIEREKLLRTLKKKLQQIDALKEKTGQLDNDAVEKIAAERNIKQKMAALEAGERMVVYREPDEDELIEMATAQKIEVEKKIKALKKKLAAIEAAKQSAAADSEQQAKIENETSLRRELGEMEGKLGVLNKSEKDRVAKKLGMEEDLKAVRAEQKKAKKERAKN